MIRAVIDTNVLFQGLTTLGPDAEIVDAWVGQKFEPCISTALAFEYRDVLARLLSPKRKPHIFGALQALFRRCEYVPIHFTYRPASPDPGDDLVVDCVLNAGAILVTRNMKDFVAPSKRLGFSVLGPAEFLGKLQEEVA